MAFWKLAGWVGAALGPLLVLAAAAATLTPVPEKGETAAIFDTMATRQPSDVVLVGASYARADFDAAALGARLDPRGRRALVFSVGASSAPVWYAVLKERVYGNGLRPTRVILPVSLGTLLVEKVPTAQFAGVLRQMPELDPVVRRRQGLGGFAAWDRALAARADVRDGWLHPFRNFLPNLFLQLDAGEVEAAANLVLGDQHAEAGPRALPTVEEARPVGSDAGELVSDPADSYLADMVALAQAGGAQVSIVLPPTLNDDAWGQFLEPGAEAAVRSWAEANRVAWIDLRQLGWDRTHFSDLRHMRPVAAREFTGLVADAILAIDPATGQPPAGGKVRLDASATRSGTPPALVPAEVTPGAGPCELQLVLPAWKFLGKKEMERTHPLLASPILVREEGELLSRPFKKGECTGSFVHRVGLAVSRRRADGPPVQLEWDQEPPDDKRPGSAWWVYPGTTLTWTVQTPWVGPITARLTSSLFGPGAGPALLSAGEASTPLQPGETAELSFTAGAPWQVSVSSPVGGPFVVVEALAVEGEPGTADLVAPPPVRSLEVFYAEHLRREGTPPDPVPARPGTHPKAGAAFQLSWRAPTDCSPYRVRHRGELLPEMPPGRRREGEGTRHTGRQLTYDPLPGTDPADYEVVHDPDPFCPKSCKACSQQVWILPGEVFTAEVPAPRRTAFATPLLRLLVEGTADVAAGTVGALGVRVRLDDRVLVERVIAAEELNRAIRLPLPSPLAAADPGTLSVEVRADASLPPVLLVAAFEDQ